MSSENEKNFAKFRKQLESCFIDLDAVPKKVVSQMADIGMNVTKKNTPVGDYTRFGTFSDASGERKTYVNFNTKAGKTVTFITDTKQGGTLRKAWKKTKVHKVGNSFVSGYSNNTEYAIYVNNGHRIVGAKGVTTGYVKPVKMLEQGINAARRQTQTLFETEIAKIKRKSGF